MSITVGSYLGMYARLYMLVLVFRADSNGSMVLMAEVNQEVRLSLMILAYKALFLKAPNAL